MERYVTGKDPNTKDWFLYDNVTDKYICWDSEKAVKARENTEKKNKSLNFYYAKLSCIVKVMRSK